MKKIILTLVVILTMTLAVSQAKATCPDGYITFTFNTSTQNPLIILPPCSMNVIYCYKLNLDGTFDIYLDGMTDITACDPNYIFSQQFRNDINIAIFQNMGNNNLLPPCPAFKINVVINQKQCWRFDHLEYQDPWTYNTYFDCPNGICKYFYKICYDMSNPIAPIPHVELDHIESDPGSPCPIMDPEIIPYGPYIHAWSVPCCFFGCN